jgi:hypothetical protein
MNGTLPNGIPPSQARPADPANRKLLIVLIALVVVAGIVAVVWRRQPAPQPAGGGATVTHLPVIALPEAFPAGLPIEAGAKIVNNYNAVSTDGKRIQATRVFESAKTVAENAALYQAYVNDTKNGWTIMNQSDGPAGSGQKFIFAKKGDGILNIGISPRQPLGSTVDLSFTTPKK